jgi:glycosyltransferase involved in cell wall biosynthesis
MAAGVPVIASRVGALPELVPERWLVAPGDVRALASAITAVRAEAGAGAEAAARAQAVVSPDVVAPALAAIYGRAHGVAPAGPARGHSTLKMWHQSGR